MNINQILELVADIPNLPNLVSGPKSFHMRKEATSGYPTTPEILNCNGIYVFTSIEDEVLYIGKSAQSAGQGVGRRVFDHLGAESKNSEYILFENHDWVNDETICCEIRSSISSGNFKVWVFVIEPDYFSRLVEVYLLTLHKHKFGSIPPLNKEI